MAATAKIITGLEARTGDGIVLMEPIRTVQFSTGIGNGERDSVTIAATTEGTLSVPTGARAMLIPSPPVSLRLRASSGGATVLALTGATSYAVPIIVPVDSATTTALYLYNAGASSATFDVIWL